MTTFPEYRVPALAGNLDIITGLTYDPCAAYTDSVRAVSAATVGGWKWTKASCKTGWKRTRSSFKSWSKNIKRSFTSWFNQPEARGIAEIIDNDLISVNDLVLPYDANGVLVPASDRTREMEGIYMQMDRQQRTTKLANALARSIRAQFGQREASTRKEYDDRRIWVRNLVLRTTQIPAIDHDLVITKAVDLSFLPPSANLSWRVAVGSRQLRARYQEGQHGLSTWRAVFGPGRLSVYNQPAVSR
jgi:hypothetical protein